MVSVWWIAYVALPLNCTAQKMEFSIKDFFSKWDQICRKLRIWSHLLKKTLMENFILCAVLNESFLIRIASSFTNKIELESSLLKISQFFYFVIIIIRIIFILGT